MTSSQDAVRLTPEAMARYIPDAAGNRFHVGLERGQRAKPQIAMPGYSHAVPTAISGQTDGHVATAGSNFAVAVVTSKQFGNLDSGNVEAVACHSATRAWRRHQARAS